MANLNRYPFRSKWISSAFFLLDKGYSLFHKQPPVLSPPKSILLSNIGHLGDAILTTSLLPVLKQTYPDVSLGMLVGSWCKPVVENHPLLSQFHLFDHVKLNRKPLPLIEKWKQHLSTSQQARKEINSISYDWMIDCRPHFPNSAFLLKNISIPHKWGFQSAGFSPLLSYSQSWHSSSPLPLVKSFLHLLSNVDAVQKNRSFLHPILPSQAPLSFLPSSYLILHPGRGEKIKEWPLEKWRELSSLLRSLEMSLIWTGETQKEAERIDSIIEQTPHCTNLAGKLSWSQFTSAIQHAKGLITVDTSAGHIASAYDTPTIVLQNGIYSPLLWLPYSPLIKGFFYSLSCAPCAKGLGCSAMSCLREISPGFIFKEISYILENTKLI